MCSWCTRTKSRDSVAHRGVRDPALLESAVAQPMATYGGEFVHVGLYQMAAAYYFHLVSNHAFVDGNKRIGLAAALTFLELNGVTIDSGTDELFELTMEVAQGRAGKEKNRHRSHGARIPTA